jgi:hypothetical protein
MIDGKFTPEERAYLLSLDAVDEVRASSLVYSKQFEEACMRRYRQGERPSKIFEDVGLPQGLIGCRRIERAVYHWKEAEKKGTLTKTEAPRARHRDKVETVKREKREAVARQRAIGARERAETEDRLARQKKRSQEPRAEARGLPEGRDRVLEGPGEGFKSAWHAGEEDPACSPDDREVGALRGDLPAQREGPSL